MTGSSIGVGGLRELAASFVVPGPAGVAIRDRLRVSETDAAVLREVGMFLGSLAAGDLAERSRQGLAHDAAAWAVRKQGLTGKSRCFSPVPVDSGGVPVMPWCFSYDGPPRARKGGHARSVEGRGG